MDLLAASRDLIAANTVSSRGTEEAIFVLRPLYEAAGLRPSVQEVVKEGVTQTNLLGAYPGQSPDGLLLVTHLDTVDPGPAELWTECEGQAFRLAQKGDRLFGLGSADTKLDALCKLAAAATFRGQPLRRSLELLGTFEEEVGGKGARHYLATGPARARFVSCSEPSELRIIRAHKGYAVVEVDFEARPQPSVSGPFETTVYEGKAAHSSTPHLGVNAIEKALADERLGEVVRLSGGTVSNKVPARCTVVRRATSGSQGAPLPSARETVRLSGLLFGAWRQLAERQKPRRHASFDPAEVVVSWGVATVEGRAGHLVFDCRLLPGHDPDALTASFTAEASAILAANQATGRVTVNRRNPAMELVEPSELLAAAKQAARTVGLPDEPLAKPTNTEAGIFATAGKEAIVFGPGRSTGNAHCPNEHNFLSQLEKAVEFYCALIRGLCL